MSKKHNYEVVDHDGLQCPRCGGTSETRKHTTPLLEKVLKQPFYYTVWFNCRNKDCKTTIFMSDDYKVWNKNGGAKHLRDFEEDQATMSFISNIR